MSFRIRSINQAPKGNKVFLITNLLQYDYYNYREKTGNKGYVQEME
jgi:hypothetical protein